MLYYTYSYLKVFYLKKNGLIKSVFLMLVNYSNKLYLLFGFFSHAFWCFVNPRLL